MAVGTTNYPTSLDTVVELVEAANNAADTLSAGISAGDASLTLTDAAEFAASGIVAIENELLSYTGKSGSTLTGLTRGIEGTTAASHSSGADVRQVITAASHNVQSAAIIALEQKLGTGTDIAWSQMSPLTANRLVVTDGAGDVTASPLTHDATNAVIGNIGGLDFDTTPTATPTTARMVWDDTHGTVNLTLKGGTVGVDIGQTTVARVVNKTVTNINLLRSNYQVVRIVSAQGQRLAISLAQGDAEPNSTDVIGLVAEDIANNQEGFIVARGLITEINTTGSLQGETWADGDILYLSPTTAGGLTKVEPQAPNHLIIVGYVVYAHSQHGKIYVAIQTSWETKELHDVKITGTPVAGSLLIRNATTGVWENATLTAGSNISITNADKSITIAGTGGVASVTGTSPVVSSGGSTPAISLASGYGDTQNPYASKTANHFLAAPNGTAGAPTFRAIVAADIPTLNQNTTGTASNVTGTVAIANGGTGATTAPNALTNLGAYPASNPNGYTSNTGTVTSVGGTGTVNGITLTGSVSTTGNLTLGGTLSGVSLTTQVTGTLPVANGGTGVTTSTGTGSVVLSNSPTLVTPSLGTATGTSFNGITGLSSTTPVADSGIGLVGTATTAARADHAHPVSGVTTISGGTTGLTPSTATSGAVTLAGTLGVANGGTGQTSYTDGQLLIGNTATGGLSKTTLTAGSNITITNGNGTISIAAAGGGREVLTANRTYFVGFNLGACTVTSTSPAVIARAGHGLSAGDPVIFSVASGGSVPPGLIAGATYYVKTNTPDPSNTFQIALTVNGPSVSVTGTGSLLIVRTGQDTGSGLTNTATSSFLTISRALDAVAGIDLAGFAVTIQLADGRYVETVRPKSYVGSGPVTIQGNASNISNVVLQPYAIGLVTTNVAQNVLALTSGGNHGFVNGTPVQFVTYGAFPGGLTVEGPNNAGTTYYAYAGGGSGSALVQFSLYSDPGGLNRVTLTGANTSIYQAAYVGRLTGLPGVYVFKNLTIGTNTGIYGVRVNTATLNIDNCAFAGQTGHFGHVWSETLAAINFVNNFTVSVGGGAMFSIGDLATVNARQSTMTLVGAPSFNFFADLLRLAHLLIDQFSIIGTRGSGARFRLETNSVIQAAGYLLSPTPTANASTDLFTLTNHQLSNDDVVIISGAGVPGGITSGASYFVVSATANTFAVSSTVGGAAIDLTSAGTTFIVQANVPNLPGTTRISNNGAVQNAQTTGGQFRLLSYTN